MATYLTSNTGSTKSTDRTAGGSKPDSTPATGSSTTTVTGAVTSVNGSVGVGASPTTGNVSVYLNTTGVTANTYGSSTTVPVIAVNAQGQITSATNTTISTLTNPMTTLGDSIYGGTSGAVTRLAGNNTTRRQYHAQTGTGSASAAPVWVNGPSYNVLDYGIIADGSTDQTSALNTLITSLPSFASLYFPSQSSAYIINGTVSCATNSICIRGDGPNGTKIFSSGTTNIVFSSSNVGITIKDLYIQTNAVRVAGYPIINISGGGNVWLDNINAAITGDGIKISGISPFCSITNCYIQINSAGLWDVYSNYSVSNQTVYNNVTYICTSAITGSSGNPVPPADSSHWSVASSNPLSGYALQLLGTAAQVTNNLFRTYNGKPCVYVTGGSTSNQYVNNVFAGGGPRYQYTPSAITSNGTNVTFTMSNTTGFNVGSFIVSQNMTTNSYNGFFLITAVNTNTSVVAKAFGTTPFYAVPSSGTGTVGYGYVATIAACMIIDTAGGYFNESILANNQFGAVGYPSDPISAGLLLDGTPANNSLEGILLDNNYVDYGRVGILMMGQIPQQGRISITGGTIVGNGTNGGAGYPALGGIWVIKCPGVSISNVLAAANFFTSTPASSFYYVYSDSSVVSDGFRLTGSSSSLEFWNGVTYSQNAQYGITIDGGPSSTPLNAIIVASNTLWGITHATQFLNSGVNGSTRVAGHGSNLLFYGTSNPPTTDTSTYF